MKYLLLICFLCLSVSVFGAGAGVCKPCDSLSGTGDCQDFNDEGSGTVIGQLHDQIEKGNAFEGNYYWADADTPQGVTITVVVPNNVTIHVRFAVEALDQALTWNLWKNNTTLDNTGTTPTAMGNAYITHANTSAVSWYIDGLTTGGSLTGRGGQVDADKGKYTGNFTDVEENVMGPGIHSYYFEPLVDNCRINIIWFWYEPE